MYKIYVGEQVLHHPNRFPDNYIVANPTMTTELNAHGSLTFKMPPDNPMYSSLQRLKSIVTVRDDYGEIIWRGRVLSDTKSKNNVKAVYCEGELGFLCDSTLRPYVHRGSVSALFSYLISNHNSQVNSERQFVVGDVTVEDANEYIVRSTSYPMTTWDALRGWLFERLGGYINLRHVGAVTYIDYLAEMPLRQTQQVAWGKNIIDISEAITAENVITCLIPYGAEFEQSDPNFEPEPQSGAWDGNRVTIKSVNGGVDYITNADGIAMFGEVWGTHTWDDVTVASNLLTKARAYLADQINAACTINVSAVDLHEVDLAIPALRVGDRVPVRSTIHGIDTTLVCRKLVIPLMELNKTRITLGAGNPAITDMR